MAHRNSQTSVNTYAAYWLHEVSARTKPQTVKRYEDCYRLHVEPTFGARPLDSIDRFELKQFIASKVATGLRARFLAQLLTSLFAAAVDDGFLEASPAAGLGKKFRGDADKPAVKVFTQEELARFLSAARSMPVYEGLFRVMAYGGLRLGEARALRCRDVHPSIEKLDVARTFSGDVLQDSAKTESSSRRIEIPHRLARELARRVDGRDPDALVFDRGGKFLRQNSCQYGYVAIAKRAAVPHTYKTHVLRHTYATRLLERGASLPYVQRQLGHAKINLTNDTYGRWARLSSREEINGFMDDTEGALPEPMTRVVPFVPRAFGASDRIAPIAPYAVRGLSQSRRTGYPNSSKNCQFELGDAFPELDDDDDGGAS